MRLNVFREGKFLPALKSFFLELNVPLNYVSDEPTTAKKVLQDTYKDNETFNLINDVYFVGMVDDASFRGEESIEAEDIRSDYDGILIFGITLHQRANHLLPTRSQLAEITRAFNREFYYTPVTLVFKYDNSEKQYIAFSNAERLKYKQEWREGEKAGKVSLLRDIDIQHPHRGHEDILNQLRIQTTGIKAVDSFDKLYKYWQEVFNVSILNKKFYQELQNWYFWAIKEVTFPNAPNRFDYDSDVKFDEAVKEHKGKNVIRLLTRLLFIWFIKEKKLVPEEIFDEKYVADNLIKNFTPQKPHGIFATGKHTSMYYRAILQNLFFATLNQEIDKRGFRIPKSHMNVTNLMRYNSYFKTGGDAVFLNLMNNVPFMNGGLFECLDKPHPEIKGKQGGDIIIYEDGFSDRDDNVLGVPDFLFFDVDEEVDISDDIGSTNRIYKEAKTRGLLEILKSYKFTITENTPIEEDVALDPELLGKVFENLLASYNPETKTTARKQTGSFYTPREIVNYMVDESLIAYLKNTIKEWDGRDEEQLDKDLHTLVAFDNPQNPFGGEKELQNQIIKALDNCKILDPACGSGAFPMGILQKMVYILHKVDPSNSEWKHRQLLRVDSAIQSLEEIDDAEFREKSIKELKQQKADIDEAFRNNELDYGRKLYLIENCIYGVDIQSIATQISKLRFFISLVVDQKIDRSKPNFGVRSLPNLETKFVAANTLIGIEKPAQQGNLFDNVEIKQLEDKLKQIRHNIFSSKTPKRKRELREEDKIFREKIAEILKNNGWRNETARQLASWDPYDQNASSPFFDSEWMFDIAEGFDVVIGNPPYVFTRDVDFDGNFKKYIEYEYFSKMIRGKKSKSNQSGKINLFAVFILKGLFVSKKNGYLTYIIPNNILRTTTYDIVRRYILENSHVEQIVDLGSGVFDNVTASTIVLGISNRKTTNKTKVITNLKNIEKYDFEIKTFDQSQFLENVSYSFNIYMDEISMKISNKIAGEKELLESFCIDNIEGIVAHKHLIINQPEEGTVPLIEGKDVKRFYINKPSNFLKWLPNQIHRTRPDYLWKSDKKIVIQRISGGTKPLVCAVDRNKFKCFASTNNLILKDKYKAYYYFISAIINSDVINWYYANNFSNNSNLTVNISKTFMDQLPVANYSYSVSFVSEVLHYLSGNLYYSNYLNILNALITNLYFPDHMKELEIEVLKFAERDIEKIMQGNDFEKMSKAEKDNVIEQLHLTWSHPDNEMVKRLAQFRTKSPDILKVILES